MICFSWVILNRQCGRGQKYESICVLAAFYGFSASVPLPLKGLAVFVVMCQQTIPCFFLIPGVCLFVLVSVGSSGSSGGGSCHCFLLAVTEQRNYRRQSFRLGNSECRFFHHLSHNGNVKSIQTAVIRGEAPCRYADSQRQLRSITT